MSAPKMGAVLYALGLERLSAFYRVIGGGEIVSSDPTYVSLRLGGSELVVLQAPASFVERHALESPPRRRVDTPIKLAFEVASLGEARRLALELGGSLDDASTIWRYEDHYVCDGVDPEGNVVQFRSSSR